MSGCCALARRRVAEIRGELRVRLLADRARVEDDHVGLVLARRLAEPELLEHALDALRVVGVHLAAEGRDGVRAHRRRVAAPVAPPARRMALRRQATQFAPVRHGSGSYGPRRIPGLLERVVRCNTGTCEVGPLRPFGNRHVRRRLATAVAATTLPGSGGAQAPSAGQRPRSGLTGRIPNIQPSSGSRWALTPSGKRPSPRAVPDHLEQCPLHPPPRKSSAAHAELVDDDERFRLARAENASSGEMDSSGSAGREIAASGRVRPGGSVGGLDGVSGFSWYVVLRRGPLLLDA